MRKVLLLLFALVAVLSADAQNVKFVSITKADTYRDTDYLQRYICRITLSNGEVLARSTSSSWYSSSVKVSAEQLNNLLETKASGALYYRGKIGQTIMIQGTKYTLVKAQKLKTLAIKSISVHNIYASNIANIGYAVKNVNDLMYPSKLLNQQGTVTVANVIFEDGSTASICIAGDPMWASATTGQKVEICKFGIINYYKLVF